MCEIKCWEKPQGERHEKRISSVKASLKALLPEDQYMENRDDTAKDSNISIFASFEVSPERQSINDPFAFFLNKL